MIFKRITMLAAVLFAAAFIYSVPKAAAYDDLSLVEKCRSDYGYNYLAKCTNGEQKQKLYNDIYKRACEIWQGDHNIRVRGDGYYVFGSYELSKYGLTVEEGFEVLFTLKNDNPIFYFISNKTAFAGTKFTVLIFDEYAKGSVRSEAQDVIYDYVTQAAADIGKRPTAYLQVKALHDMINAGAEYERTGGRPSDRADAHNIIGVIRDGTGVCESYARTFELVLNYADIDNVLVTGTANYDNHAWNMAKLDDGRYYYFDCTWDDLLKRNKFLAVGSNTLSKSHTASKPTQRGMDFLYALPEVSAEDYVPPKTGFELGDVNTDGIIDIEDVVVLIGYLNGNNLLEDTSLADVNRDGTVDIEDAVMIVGYVNGKPF